MCKACRDLGRVYVTLESGAVESRPCPKCGSARIVKGLQSVYPLPPEWDSYNVETFKPIRGEERMAAHARRYAADMRGWFVVQGGPGNGKTVTLAGILNAAKARGLHGLFLPAHTIADLIYRALEPGTDFSLARLENDLRYVDLLVIDEMDKVDWSKIFVHDTFYNVLNWRYEHVAPTAIAFNEDTRIAGPAPAIYSRLRDGRWGDGRGDGILRNEAEDVRPYLPSLLVQK